MYKKSSLLYIHCVCAIYFAELKSLKVWARMTIPMKAELWDYANEDVYIERTL